MISKAGAGFKGLPGGRGGEKLGQAKFHVVFKLISIAT